MSVPGEMTTAAASNAAGGEDNASLGSIVTEAGRGAAHSPRGDPKGCDPVAQWQG